MQPALILAQEALTEACGSEPGLVCEFVYEVTGSVGLAQFADVIQTPLSALLILGIAWLVNRLVRRLIERAIGDVAARQAAEAAEAAAEFDRRAADETKENLHARDLRRAEILRESSVRKEQRTKTLGDVLANATAIVIYTIAGFMALSEFNVNVGPLIASAGIAGVALGFGAQSLVKDFLSGFFMLIEDQYGVGDIIDVGDATGTVEEVHLRTTQIRDVHGTLWHVPNGEIRRIGNHSQEWARTILDIEVAYDTDIPFAVSVIERVADEVWAEGPAHATILEEPEVWGVEALGANSVVIRLALKVEPAEQWATGRLIRQRIKAAFDEAGIEIPFPQRTIWMNEVTPAARATAAPGATGDDTMPGRDS